jgi:1-deoxy-D-xylulose-5-phosphate synthase
MDRAGLVGDDGPTHHGAFDISVLSFIPNLVLLAPRDTTELREMTHFLKDYSEHPTAVRYPRGAGDDRLPEQRTPIQIGKAELLSEGDDITLCAVGSMVSVAWEAKDRLAEHGIHATVINARFVKPIDVATIAEHANRTGRLLTMEENVRTGGFGQQVRDALADMGCSAHVAVIALPDAFIEHGAQPLIRADAGISAESVVAEAMKMLGVPNDSSPTKA